MNLQESSSETSSGNEQSVLSSPTGRASPKELQEWMSSIWDNLERMQDAIHALQVSKQKTTSAEESRQEKKIPKGGFYLPTWFMVLASIFSGVACLSLWSMLIVFIVKKKSK